MITTCLFDLDGTLADVCDIHYDALNLALFAKGYQPINREDHDNIYNGLSTKQKLEILCNKGFVLKKDCESIEEDKQRITVTELSKIPLDWSKIRLMQRLYEDGYKMGCITNAIRATTKLILEKIGVYEYFDHLVCNEDVPMHLRKPDPYPYFLAFDFFKCTPKECIIFEDSDKGYQSAYLSGASCSRVKNAKELTKDFVYREIYYKNGMATNENLCSV